MRTYQRQLPYLPEHAEEQLPAADIPSLGPPSGLSTLQVLTIARHYWKKSAVIALTAIILMAVLIRLLPKSYTATATLIVNTTQQNPLPNQQYANESLDSYVATQAELIVGRAVLVPVVDRLMLTNDPAFGGDLRGANTTEARDFASRTLANRLQVTAGNGGQLLNISVSAANPAEAATIANTIADVYLEQNRKRANDPVAEQAQLSSQELEQLRNKVIAVQAKATAFRDHYGLTSLTESSTDAEMQALTTLQTRLLVAQNERRSLEAQQAGKVENGDQAMASEQVNALRQQLATLQTRLAQLRPTLGPSHPEILGLEAQSHATEQALRQALGNLSNNIETQLSREQKLEAELTQAVADQRAKVLQIRQIQDDGSKLELELQSAQSVYKQALGGYDQVKFATAQNFANVDWVSRATPPVLSSKPKKWQLFVMACLLSVAAGLLLPFLYEMLMNRRVRCRDDLERGLGVRVLAQLESPSLSSESP